MAVTLYKIERIGGTGYVLSPGEVDEGLVEQLRRGGDVTAVVKPFDFSNIMSIVLWQVEWRKPEVYDLLEARNYSQPNRFY
jgi:hypothetical protein